MNGSSGVSTIRFHPSLANQEKHGADRFHSLIFRPAPKRLLERKHLDVHKPSDLEPLPQKRTGRRQAPNLAERLVQHLVVFLEAFPHGVVVGERLCSGLSQFNVSAGLCAAG